MIAIITGKGMLITFEGIDASGKTTQLTLVHQWFQEKDFPVTVVREPGGTDISENIRSIILDPGHNSMSDITELMLFSAARAQLCHEVIAPFLEKGFTVLCDRFYDSTTAYQGYGRGIDLDAIHWINGLVIQQVRPHLSIFLDISHDVAVKRMITGGSRADRMEMSTRAFFERVRTGYHAIAASEPERCVLIDGTRDPNDIHRELIQIIELRMENNPSST